MCGCIPPAPPPPAPPPAPPLCQPPSFTHHLSHTISHTHLCQPPSFTHHLSHAIFTHFVNHHLSYTISHTPPLLCLYLWLKMQNSCGAFTGCFLVFCWVLCWEQHSNVVYTHIYIYEEHITRRKVCRFKYPYLSGRRNLDSSHVWYVGKAPGLFRRVTASCCI